MFCPLLVYCCFLFFSSSVHWTTNPRQQFEMFHTGLWCLLDSHITANRALQVHSVSKHAQAAQPCSGWSTKAVWMVVCRIVTQDWPGLGFNPVRPTACWEQVRYCRDLGTTVHTLTNRFKPSFHNLAAAATSQPSPHINKYKTAPHSAILNSPFGVACFHLGQVCWMMVMVLHRNLNLHLLVMLMVSPFPI